MPKIFVLTGPDVGQTFDVQSGAVFGRAGDCAVRLQDTSVSRHHARLEETVAGWSLIDLDSRNGLFLAGARLERVPLEEATEFSLGEVVLRFRAGTSPRAVTPIAPVVAVDDERIVLEGDWDESKQPAPAAVTSFTPRARATPARSSPPPSPAPTAPSLARQQVARKLEAAGVTARSTPAGSRGVLQYGKLEARSGFFQADFDQHPLWIKALIGLGVLAACAVCAWFAFRAVMMVRGTTQGPTATEEGPVEGG